MMPMARESSSEREGEGKGLMGGFLFMVRTSVRLDTKMFVHLRDGVVFVWPQIGMPHSRAP